MWAHMFTDCARALHVDTSTWSTVPLFQPPPPPQPVSPPLLAKGTSAQPDSDVAMGADNLKADLLLHLQFRDVLLSFISFIS